MPIRAVVFDLFDTLVDLRSEDVPLREHRGTRIPASVWQVHALVAEGHPVDFDAFQEAFMAGMRAFQDSHLKQHREVKTIERFTDTLARLGIEDAELAHRMTELHMGVLRGAVRVPGHHVSVLESLRPRVRLGLCSNFSHSATAERILAESGLGLHLDAVVVSDAFGWRKPRGEIFQEVVARLGVSPAEALHVGDSLHADVAGAAAVGLRTGWITRRVRATAEKLAEHTGPLPDFSFADLAEVIPVVEGAALPPSRPIR
jgi:putative hydrolase of the HAD superfamily